MKTGYVTRKSGSVGSRPSYLGATYLSTCNDQAAEVITILKHTEVGFSCRSSMRG